MQDAYLFSAAKCVISMQTPQAAAEVVFQTHATCLAVVHLALVLPATLCLLLTVACMLTNTFSHESKMEGWIVYFDGFYLFHRSWF